MREIWNRLTALVNKNREKLSFAVLINAVLLAALLVVFRPGYETNDDMGLNCIVNGTKGSFDAHMVHCKYLFGLILSGLYRMWQSVPWHAIGQYALLFISFTLVTLVVLRRQKGKWTAWISAAALIFFAYEGYIRLQYTKTAGIITAAGILVMFYAVEGEKIRKRYLAAGVILACFGFMYRAQQFFAVAALMTPIGLYQLLELKNAEKGKRLPKILSYVKAFGLLLFCVALLYGTDRMAYRSPQWQEYEEYNWARTLLFDYGFPDYSENREEYEKLGIDENAYKLIRGWNYFDTEKFTLPVMKELISLRKEKQVNAGFFVRFVKKVVLKFPTITAFGITLVLILYWLLFSRHGYQDLLTALYTAFLVLALYLFLFYQGRYLYNRVDVSIWMAVSLAVLWVYRPGERRLEGWCVPVALAAACFCISFSCGKYLRTNTSSEKKMVQERQAIEAVMEDKEHLYLAKSGELSFAKSYGVFETPPFGSGDNIMPLGGWTAHTPLYRSVMEKYGIVNPYRDMIGNETVYLVDNNIEVTMQYIHTYYDPDAEAVLVKEIGGHTVYQIK
ncbi:MAG: hypothetical protein Q4C50_12775 [Eubacteriales bacterium]|nr:hypothetical protein [Eubacteriales bacterium]